jgi:hypothetical protein
MNRRMTKRDQEVLKNADVSEQSNGLLKMFQSRMQSRNYRVQKIEVNAYNDAGHSTISFAPGRTVILLFQ